MSKPVKALRILPDKMYLQIMYYKHFKKFIHFNNPVTFNEKLQWLKIHDRKEEYTLMVDKYRVKEYVASIIGEQYIIPTLGMWENAEDIQFDSLPKQFVLKCNNDSGGIVICKDKDSLDVKSSVELLSKRMKNNGFWYGREWPYKNIKPCIIAEKYLDNGDHDLIDYKIHNFNGEPRFILVCQKRFSLSNFNEDFYDCDWNRMNVSRPGHVSSSESMVKPPELEEMLRLSKILSKGIPFLRTDFYIVNGHIYFGELTFYPGSGFAQFKPFEYDKSFGEWLDI